MSSHSVSSGGTECTQCGYLKTNCGSGFSCLFFNSLGSSELSLMAAIYNFSTNSLVQQGTNDSRSIAICYEMCGHVQYVDTLHMFVRVMHWVVPVRLEIL